MAKRRGGSRGGGNQRPTNPRGPKPDMNREQVRLFAGVRISMRAVADISEMVESMQALARRNEIDVRWVNPVTYHLTLKFLGWSRVEVIDAIRDEISDALAAVDAFEMTMHGVGAFPSPAKATVLWAGIKSGGDELTALAARIDEATARLGYEVEARQFHPHVTIGRLKQATDASGLLLPYSHNDFAKTKIDSVVLFESELMAKGAEYIVRAEWPLCAPHRG